MTKTSKYLYGVSAKAFKDLRYQDALIFKIRSAERLVKDLVKEHYMVRDEYRISDIQKAVKFNRALLAEIEV